MLHNPNDVDALSVEDDSTSPVRFHYLAHWRHPRADAFGPMWSAANGARNAVRGFYMKKRSVLADSRLSDAAKADDIRAAGVAALEELGDHQRRINAAADRADAQRLKLADVQPATPAEVTMDLAIAAHIRGLVGNDREVFLQQLVTGGEPRAVAAVLRVPAFLVGITPEMSAVIRSAAIRRESPNEVAAIDALGAAIATAQHVVQRCADLLAQSVSLPLAELMKTYGDGAWQKLVRGPKAPMEALARHYAIADAEGAPAA